MLTKFLNSKNLRFNYIDLSLLIQINIMTHLFLVSRELYFSPLPNKTPGVDFSKFEIRRSPFAKVFD